MPWKSVNRLTGQHVMALSVYGAIKLPPDSGGIMGSCWSFICLSVCPTIFSFPDDNLSKSKWIFTKFGVCIDIVEIWFGIANGQISPIFDSPLPKHVCIFIFRRKC